NAVASSTPAAKLSRNASPRAPGRRVNRKTMPPSAMMLTQRVAISESTRGDMRGAPHLPTAPPFGNRVARLAMGVYVGVYVDNASGDALHRRGDGCSHEGSREGCRSVRQPVGRGTHPGEGPGGMARLGPEARRSMARLPEPAPAPRIEG